MVNLNISTMNKISYLLFVVIFFSCIEISQANENDTIVSFKKEIDSLLVSLKNPTNVRITKQLGGRKIKVKGYFENETKSFKQKIKYNSGVKKESIKVYYCRYKKDKLVMMKVVLIDNQYFFLQKNTYKSIDLALKFTKETYVAERIYKRVEFDANKKMCKKNYLWSMLTPSERH
jgi:hypothetical protein